MAEFDQPMMPITARSVTPRISSTVAAVCRASCSRPSRSPASLSSRFHSSWSSSAQSLDPPLAGLVANHSCAAYEADERGLAEVLVTEFPQEQSPTADALWSADMTTGPDGQDLGAEERLAEIRQRYGPNDIVTRFWWRAEPALMGAVRRTQQRLADQPM